jgi:hypothetical protein
MGRERLARASIECGMNRGHIFQGRHKSLQVQSGERLAARCHSIPLNPVQGRDLRCVSVGDMTSERSERDHGAEAASAMVRGEDGLKSADREQFE